MKRSTTIIIALLVSLGAYCQDFTTLEEKTVEVKQTSVLSAFNINGPVTIEGSSRGSIEISYSLKAREKASGGLDTASEELKFVIEEFDDSLSIRLDAPFVRHKNGRRHVNINSDQLDYWFKCDIVIRVPSKINLITETINSGDLLIKNIEGFIVADNVNGSIDINKVRGRVVAETVNGNIRVDFLENPFDGSKFQTVNGDIKTLVPTSLSANLSFKSLNGEFYTDFDYSTGKTGRLSKVSRGKSMSYKVEQITTVTIGEGRSGLYYETINGDMYLRKL